MPKGIFNPLLALAKVFLTSATPSPLRSRNKRIRFARVSVTKISPVGVSASQRGRSNPSANTFTWKPAGTFRLGLDGTATTFGGREALVVAKGWGKSFRVI